MMTLQSISRHHGDQVLMDRVSLHLAPRVHYGVVGSNGAGKSTLLRILAGQESPDSGQLTRRSGLNIAMLEQDQFQYDDLSIVEVVERGAERLSELHRQMDELTARMAETTDSQLQHDLGLELSHQQDEYLHHGGYELRSRAEQILSGLGFKLTDYPRKLSEFSGGFKTRVLLGKLLLSDADLYLLDEPTNHLDLATIHWLANFLHAVPKTMLVVSHDRDFLNFLADRILVISCGKIREYQGNYDDYLRQSELASETDTRVAERAGDRIRQLQRFVDSFGAKASKARQAHSKEKMIEKLKEEQSSLQGIVQREPVPHFTFSIGIPSSQNVLQVRGLKQGFGDLEVFREVSFMLRKGERLAVVAPNGVGKTTLLKTLVGVYPPIEGSVHWGSFAQFGYFAQQQVEVLPSEQTIYDHLSAVTTGERLKEIRRVMGGLLFSGDLIRKKIGSLSGGEQARVVFGQLMLQQPNVLVLDEPTNHLDIKSREVLLKALQKYEGTILFVSHDKFFVSQLANRVLHLVREQSDFYPGTYDEFLQTHHMDYLDHQEQRRVREQEKKTARRGAINCAPTTTPVVNKAERRKQEADKRQQTQQRLGPIRNQLSKCETEIATLEARRKEVDRLLAHPKRVAGKVDWARMKELGQEKKQIEERLQALMISWEVLQQQVST